MHVVFVVVAGVAAAASVWRWSRRVAGAAHEQKARKMPAAKRAEAAAVCVYVPENACVCVCVYVGKHKINKICSEASEQV